MGQKLVSLPSGSLGAVGPELAGQLHRLCPDILFSLVSVTLGHCSCPPGPRGLTLHRQEGRGEGHWAHPVFAGASGRNNQLQEHVGDRVSAWNAGAQLQTGISRVMPRGRILGGAGCRCPLCGLLPHLPPYLPSQSTGKPLF